MSLICARRSSRTITRSIVGQERINGQNGSRTPVTASYTVAFVCVANRKELGRRARGVWGSVGSNPSTESVNSKTFCAVGVAKIGSHTVEYGIIALPATASQSSHTRAQPPGLPDRRSAERDGEERLRHPDSAPNKTPPAFATPA